MCWGELSVNNQLNYFYFTWEYTYVVLSSFPYKPQTAPRPPQGRQVSLYVPYMWWCSLFPNTYGKCNCTVFGVISTTLNVYFTKQGLEVYQITGSQEEWNRTLQSVGSWSVWMCIWRHWVQGNITDFFPSNGENYYSYWWWKCKELPLQ